MDQPWQIELFGWLRATRDDQVVSRFRTQRAGALLAYLAYHRDRSHPREALIEQLWPESDPHLARASLRTELNSLRRQLEPPGVPSGAVLLATRATLRLNPEACRTDVSLFEAALQAAGQAQSPAAQAQQLATAASLYRGELLPGYYEEWILPEQQRLAEAFLQAVHELVELLEELGDLPGALQWARRAVAADLLDEESHHRLIRLLLASGQVEAARVQFEQGERLLLQELGVGLAPEIRDLVRDLAPSKDRPATIPGGKRRRERRNSPADPEPERWPTAPPAGGEGAATLSPQWPAAAASRPSHNLPLRFTRFFGREREIEQLCEAVGRRLSAIGGSEPAITDGRQPMADGPKLVTLTGPGGTGKTRLALQVAQQLRNAFPGGVWFTSLRELTDPSLIPDQILLALRLARSPESEALQQVVAFLSQAPALLVLDNYEHLVEGGAECARQLLERVEQLTLLATSRRCLGLEGEREFPVAPLPVPEAVDSGQWLVGRPTVPTRPDPTTNHYPLSTVPSVALFVDRAQAVRPDFQVTARNAPSVGALCQRLEGLPLAIELAAARSRALTPQQMLCQLEAIPPLRGSLPSGAGARSAEPGPGRFELLVSRQRPADPRHHSLRATLDWSYQLLSPELRRFFARLSVFRGGWTVAAAAVCGDFGFWILDFGLPATSKAPEGRESLSDPAQPMTLDGRTSLSDPIQNPKSKIQNTLEYLEQLRECSLVQAVETGGEIRFHLLETLREYGAEQLAAEERAELARRHAHFFLALAETAETELCGADQVLWLDRLEQELDNLRAALTWCAETVGSGQWSVGSEVKDSGSALPTAHCPLPTAVELGLRLGSALERFWQTRGHVKEGRTQLLRLLAAPGAAASTAVRARALSTAGLLTSLQDDVLHARALLEESLALWRRLEDPAGIAAALLHLGWFEYDRCEYASALRRAEECLALRRELGEPGGLADALELTATVRGQGGDPIRSSGPRPGGRSDPQARGLLEESIAIWRALGDRISATRGLASLARWTMCEGELDTARRLHEEVLAAATELGDRPRVGWVLFGLGEVAQVQEDYASARAFYERSLPLWQELDDKHGLMKTRFFLGHSLMRQGDAAAAYARFAEILVIAREAKWRGAVAESLAFLGATAGDLGRWEETAARCAESLELCGTGESQNFHLAIEWNLIEVARVALVRGKPARAARLLGAAEALVGPVAPARRRELDSAASAVRAQMEAVDFEAAWTEGRAMPLDQAIALALQEVSAG